jgi:formate dehydrogenase
VPHGWGTRIFDPHRGSQPEVHGANRNLAVSRTIIDPLAQTPAFNCTAVAVRRAPPDLAPASTAVWHREGSSGL